jgi:hypothetical protein
MHRSKTAPLFDHLVETGIDEGDVVVTDGHLLLTDRARVNVREARTGV